MKKVLSIVLSLAMVVCLMPSMAFAATTTASATTSSFTDMANATWAIPYVEYAANLNIVNGYGNGQFGPSDTVTYEQAATMIVRALGYTDECKEMNGTWPAIYIQKATALGLFEDVTNGGSTGANRGDIAIMLYNGIDLPEVYADGDGATQYKNGSTVFQGNNGNTFKGTSMLATLNKSGNSEYRILTAGDADDAIINVRAYVGAAGKIYTDKNGNVISIGDLQSEFLTGTVNGDGDEFTTTDGTKYTVNDNAFSAFHATDSSTIDKDETSVSKLVNGKANGTVTDGANGLLDSLDQNKPYTLAVKVSGKTITNIFTVAEWSKTETGLFEESDASTIKNKQALYGYDFNTDDDGDVDTTSFILTGVDSLDKIAEDNVVYVYADSNKVIRKVEVGTEVVEGTFEAFTEGTNKSDGDAGKKATFTIAGKDYQGTAVAAAGTDPYVWTTSDDSDSVVSVGDDVKAYLDASGKIYQIEQTAANSTDYALVLNYALYDSSNQSITGPISKSNTLTKTYDQTGLNGDKSLLKVMTGAGEVVTLTMKDQATIDTSADAFGYASVITYSMNSSNKVKSVTVKSASDTTKTATKDVTTKGYYDGKAIVDSAVIFTVDGTYNNSTAIDEDDVEVIKLDSLKGTDDVVLFGSHEKNGKYDVMVLNGAATSSDVHYGVITAKTSINNDDYNANYKVTVLEAGESKSLYVDDDIADSAYAKNGFYAYKLGASGYITKIEALTSAKNGIFSGDMKDKTKTYLGYIESTGSGIKIKSGVASSYDDTVKTEITLDSEVLYVNYSSSNGTFTTADKSDMTAASAGKVALYFDTDKDDDKDGVADLVIIATKAQANTLMGYNVFVTNAVAPVIGTQPAATTNVAYNTVISTPLSVAATVSDGGMLTYQWYSNTTSSNAGGTMIDGATNASCTPNATTTPGDAYYYCVVTNTNNSVNGTKTATIASNVAKVTTAANTL